MDDIGFPNDQSTQLTRLHEWLKLRISELHDQDANQLYDPSRVFDLEYLDEIYSTLSLGVEEFNLDDDNPISHCYSENNLQSPRSCKITIGGDSIFAGVYRSATNLNAAIKVYLAGQLHLIDVVRASTRPVKDALVPFEVDLAPWDRIKVDVAFKVNRLKLIQNQDIAHDLLQTGNRKLVYESPTRWDIINSKILMIIRENLRRQTVSNVL
ncbi:uncharacterized protein LOC128394215 [Panonychus citri]|uniref:uncharacterized protein LOC128394215 n=1 Tax=Panonychus citri TaxID=50023 RepID=UPI00230813AC|nr:uncharacterized protein LOC128394215 [Panonychus citri]XP_053210482.1 uncharacterized protein LOC128394215 [Panonychus citri]